jgi:hypothetical protein
MPKPDIDEVQPYMSRQKDLQTHFSHDCTCATCTLSSPSTDNQISTILSLRAELQDFHPFLSRKYPATTDQALELVTLCEESGLYGALREAYRLAAVRFCMWEDEARTKDFVALWKREGGSDINGDWQGIHEAGELPKESWCWGLAGLKSDDPYYG